MPVEQIVIVGGGIAGWCTASALARKTQCRIVVVDAGGVDDSLGVETAVISTLPSAAAFHADMGHDENEMLSACGGAFSLGTAISNLSPGAPAFIPFGDIGAAIGPVGFHHLVARMRSEGRSVNLANFSVAALCAQAGRFARPAAGDRTVLSSLEYGYHLPGEGYAQWLCADALAHGAEHVASEVTDFRRDAHGLVTELVLQNGAAIAGDLFIDASGPSAALIQNCDGFAFEDWRHWFPTDRSIATAAADTAEPPPYTHIDAHSAGLQRFSPIQGAIGEQMLFASEFSAERIEEAKPFAQGRCRQPWIGNCLALGGAAATIDPATPLPLHMLHNSIRRLLTLLPHDRSCRIEAREYNRQFDEECDGARDFALLPYLRNGRHGEPLWDHCRGVEAPERLNHRIALYEQTGRIAQYDGDVAEATTWVMWLDALGIRPKRYDVMAESIPVDQIAAHLERIRSIMLNTLAILPSHGEYLAKHCPTRHGRAV